MRIMWDSEEMAPRDELGKGGSRLYLNRGVDSENLYLVDQGGVS